MPSGRQSERDHLSPGFEPVQHWTPVWSHWPDVQVIYQEPHELSRGNGASWDVRPRECGEEGASTGPEMKMVIQAGTRLRVDMESEDLPAFGRRDAVRVLVWEDLAR